MEVRIGDEATIKAYGKGDTNILVFSNGQRAKRYLSDVLHVPNLMVNLFSSGACLAKDIKIISDNKICKFIKNGKIEVSIHDNKLYVMQFKTISAQENTQANVANKIETLIQ